MNKQGKKSRRGKKVSKTLILQKVSVQTAFLATISVICTAIIGGLFVAILAISFNQVQMSLVYFPEAPRYCQDVNGNIAHVGMDVVVYQEGNNETLSLFSITDPQNPKIYIKDLKTGRIVSPLGLNTSERTNIFNTVRTKLLQTPFTCSVEDSIPSTLTSQFPNIISSSILSAVKANNSGESNAIHPITHAIDNNTSTYYMACNNGQVSQSFNSGGVIVDLGSVVKLAKVELDFRKLWEGTDYPGAAPCSYDVTISEDGLSYQRVGGRSYGCSFGDSNDQAPDQTLNFDYGQYQGRYVKLYHYYINDRTGWCLALNEFKVFKYDQ